MTANKVRYGLKNIYIAPVTVGANNAVTFGTPKALPGAVNVEIAPRGETSDFWADDMIYFSGRSSSGYDITAEVALVPDWFKKDYLGLVEDDNGVLVETSGGNTDNYFAFLFEFTGDQNAIRHALYYCKATAPTLSGATMADGGPEPATTEINITSLPRPDNKQVQSCTAEETDATAYNSWYSTVYEPEIAGQ